ncbi:IS1595 family transposase, partial [Nitrosomonas mobilis]|uniref:IS1595 family transposase n=1 Tax=Nitrosomonas mobilis TaxID=51642 RepID=UPI00115FA100
MKATDFREWLEKISQLNRRQKEQAKDYLSEAKPQAVVVKYLEDFFEPSCPVCQADRPYRWGHQAGLQRFRCCLCKHTFTAISGTPLARLRHKEQWLNYSAALIEGLTVRASGRQCGIDKNTSFRWRHRFLTLPAATKANHLQGIIEADETFFPSSCKGQRHLNRPPRKRGKQIHVRGTGKDQVPVLVVRDRSGATADFMLNALDKKTIEPPLRAILAKDAIFCSDGAAVYRSVAHSLGITHRPVNLSAGIRVIAGVYHIQNVNAYDSRLKQWMKRFHGVATKYLENYLGWRRWLERWGGHNSPIIG